MMKKKIIVLLTAMLAFCPVANAQWGDILGKVAGAASDNSTLSGITGLITSKLIPTEQQIIGTWAYQEPAVMFTSDNALKSAASSACQGVEGSKKEIEGDIGQKF